MGYVFRIHPPDEGDGEVESWLDDAYSAGEQRHLKRRAQGSGSDN